MEIQEQLNRQRVKHIVSSYQLFGNEVEAFDTQLEALLKTYSSALIELALVETLTEQWSNIPMERGLSFLAQTQDKLKSWEQQPIISKITPEQFQQITGLNPLPVFGSAECPPTRPILHPSGG